MGIRNYTTPRQRRTFLENTLKISLSAVGRALLDKETSVHCENLIGATSAPLGVAGPLKIQNSKSETQNYYIPLATTEGALVASVNRGSKAITLSGGANVYTERIGTTRGPVFYTESLEKNKKLYEWLILNEDLLQKVAEKTSHHLTFLKMDIKRLARYVFVRFYFDTQDAMGMNMATIAVKAMADVIEKETGVSCLSVAGNFDIDKKPAWLNVIAGRGFSVWAETILEKKVIETVLKTSLEKLFHVWLGKCVYGSLMSGSLGFNAHFANIVAAFYIATGQDVAHVVEGSMGITAMEIISKTKLSISVYLPAVIMGTIGGGTRLKTQTEALSIIGVKHSSPLAEVLGGAVLAGEISLLGSLSEGTLAQAHMNLGR